MLKAVTKASEEKMNKSIHAFEEHIATVRTGRASTKVFEDLMIPAYGAEQPLKQLAGITTPDAKTIAIQPWDQGLLGAIEKAIMGANLGFTPTNDGKLIRITVPPLTEERRRELVKQLHHMAEEARVAVRNLRRHANEEIKAVEKKHEIGEDERDRSLKKIQGITDDHIKQIDKILEAKEADIMKV